MDAILEDVNSCVRRTMLAGARQALDANDPAKASEQYRSLARILRAEAERISDPEAAQKKLAAAAYFESQASVLQNGTPGARSAANVAATKEVRGPTRWEASERQAITLEDVVGLDDTKADIRRTVLTPLAHPQLAERFRVGTGGGLLFFGPPGTGKTMLARAIAGTVNAPLFIVKASDLLSKWQGESEANLASLFEEARRHKMSIIFVDEFQWLAPRQDQADMSETGRRMLCQLLQELQELQELPDKVVLFLAATNYPWRLDDAAIRLGRFQKHLFVPPPDENGRRLLFRHGLSGRPTDTVDYCRLAELTDCYTSADILTIIEATARAALDQSAVNKREMPITQELLENEIAHTSPSASREMIRKCEKWAHAHN